MSYSLDYSDAWGWKDPSTDPQLYQVDKDITQAYGDNNHLLAQYLNQKFNRHVAPPPSDTDELLNAYISKGEQEAINKEELMREEQQQERKKLRKRVDLINQAVGAYPPGTALADVIDKIKLAGGRIGDSDAAAYINNDPQRPTY
jgi:hypothetical protein